MIDILTRVRSFFTHHFNLQEDRAEESHIVSSIRREVDFRGAHFQRHLRKADRIKLQQWLQQRYQSPSLKLITP